jgi:aldehyde dehydrogenase (NAD+)
MSQDIWIEEHLLVDGKLEPASSGKTFDNVNPTTEEVVGVVADGSSDDMDRAIGAARRAFDEGTWASDVAFRVKCLRQLQQAFVNHRADFTRTIVTEVGTPISLTNMAQYDTPVSGIGWVADLAERYDWEEDLGTLEVIPGMPAVRTAIREPIGVVGAITPWNYPVQINLAKAAPALAAGNTVVLKPAPDTPWSATLMGRLIAEETDIPPGVVNIITSSDHAVGEQLAADPRVDMVSFTGSTRTGRRVMEVGAPTIKKVFLELGGKSAAIALDDADLATAAAMGAFQVTTHGGQGCATTTRLLVPKEKMDEATEIAKATLESIPVGDPFDEGTIMGPLISKRQQERVLGYIQIGIDEGATVVTGGGTPAAHPTGWYVEPTLLVGIDNSARVAREEIFGPVLVILPYDGVDDAVAIANDSDYGLSGAVFSASDERALEVARRIRTGTVSLNGGMWYGPDVPFGGYRQSGIGRESGVQGFEEYLEIKSVARPA